MCLEQKKAHNISDPNLALRCNCADSKITLAGVDLTERVITRSIIAYLENICPLVIVVSGPRWLLQHVRIKYLSGVMPMHFP